MDTDARPDWQETQDLVRRAQTGDDTALEAVIQRYYPRVLGLVRRRLGTDLRRYTESDDLVQETMGDAVRCLGDFRMEGEEPLLRWLSQLVENRIRDTAKFYRAGKRSAARVVPLEFPGGSSRDVRPPSVATGSQDDPAQCAVRSEATRHVRLRLSQLSDRYREVIELRAGQCSWQEVADAMHLPSAEAARRMHSRAWVALLRKIEQAAPESGLDGSA